MVAARSTRTGTRRGKNSGGDGTPSTTTSVTTTTAARVRKRSRDVTIGVHVPPPPPTSSRRHRPSVDIPTPRGSPLVDGQALTMQGAGDGAGDDATSAASSMDVVENVCTPPLSTRNGDTADADMDPDASFGSTTSTTTAIAESETRELLGQVQGENETETRELLGQVEGEDVMVSINDKRERRRRASIMHEDTADGFDEDVVDDAESEALRTPIMSKADLMEDIVMANVVNTEDGLLPEKEASTSKKTVVAATEETAEALARRTSASLALVEIQGYFNELVDA